MSCYFRHLKDIFTEAGIEITPDNKKQVDQAIHQIIGINYKDCPATWRRIKQQIADNEKRQEIIRKLSNAIT